MSNDKKRSPTVISVSLKFMPTYDVLHELYPTAFDANNPVPLAVGIRQSIVAAGHKIPSSALNHFLYHWASKPAYRMSIIKGEFRINLDGSKGDDITRQDKDYARKEVDKTYKFFASKATENQKED